ncbi:EpsD family peptidyl-prolyl cis-trans isomerase [Aquariibacter albus]|uniref:Peptidyl-prolyl cis-trans isomerase, EpsD family n=1 Tax=Aquariibacter albus TaxID=2759899 RepID=A0A839HSD1_9BURK|nr:EpsD family peptidyl-prolyl cis-trans isomerase [Aquariibacter albus]MBB1162528.1 peptidyl-prolyl cis-trans isomerase, EpsD family [Aquariibacter albus]
MRNPSRNDTSRYPLWRLSLSLVATSTLLAACGGDNSSDKPATQVAAKVNKEELSVHQINFLLARQGNLAPEQVEPAGRVVLDKLIDQELTVQKAIEQKMDRDPRVVQALDASRREIIARAYVDRIGNSAKPPTEDEIRDYYTKNPALFSQRRIYQLQEFVVDGTIEEIKALHPKVTAAKDAGQLAEIMRGSGLKFGASQAVRAAEQIPLAVLPRFAKLRDGEIMVNLAGTRMQAIYLASSRSAPVDETQARPAIERFLLTEAKRELITKDLKALREAAKIEYLGKFADMKNTQPAPAEAKTGPALDMPVPASAAIAPPTPAVVPPPPPLTPLPPPPPPPPAEPVGDDTLNRGLRGLK